MSGNKPNNGSAGSSSSNNGNDPLAFAERKWQDFLGEKGGGLTINPLRWTMSVNCHGFAAGLYTEKQMSDYMGKLIYVQRLNGMAGD